MLGLVGVTEIFIRLGAMTAKLVEPEVIPTVAVMVTDPTDTEVAFPFVPAALLMAALDGSEELHVTAVVRSCVLPSV
jgi:hypothetical protein